MTIKNLEQQLNAPIMQDRLDALKELKKLVDNGEIEQPIKEGYTNNHVHTTYSFSPYSPTKAIWMGFLNGLDTIGIMDHDSLSGAKEFVEAGEIIGIATTIGFEMRTDWSKTPLINKRLNNTEQDTCGYIAGHGVPYCMIDTAIDYLTKIRDARNIRNMKQVDKINEMMAPYDISIDFEKDVIPISYNAVGGSITERHILYALAIAMIKKVGRGKGLIDLLENKIGLPLVAKQKAFFLDIKSPIYEYDVLNVLKGYFVKDIYVRTEVAETPYIDDALAFIKSIGAISSYCYLGDVGESPTGDKKAQKFEDDYLEEVLDTCKDLGFNAIAFMPSRNTRDQLIRVMRLCQERGFMQICGEDINQPRQSFICKELKDDIYSHLTLSTWALVGHEIAARDDMTKGLFAKERPHLNDALEEYYQYAITKYK